MHFITGFFCQSNSELLTLYRKTFFFFLQKYQKVEKLIKKRERLDFIRIHISTKRQQSFKERKIEFGILDVYPISSQINY
jgi:hypothetical protein